MLEEYFYDDAMEFMLTYLKKYLKHFYIQYENEIFENDKKIRLSYLDHVYSDFTFNGFNLEQSDGQIALVDKEKMSKLVVDADCYYSYLIARTEDANLKAVFAYTYSDENHDKNYNYKYYVANVDSSIHDYIYQIDEMKRPITNITIVISVLVVIFVIADALFTKRKNEKRFYLTATGDNAKDNCFKSALFNSLPYAFIIWPLSLIVYVSFIPLVQKYSHVTISIDYLNVLYLFLMSLAIVLVSFFAIYILFNELRRTHDKAVEIKNDKEKK